MPTRSSPNEVRAAQRQAALDRANARRVELRDLKIALKGGSVDPWPLLAGEDDEREELVAGMDVDSLLRMVPGIGKGLAFQILEAFVCSPSTKVGKLSFARRAELVAIAKGARGPA